MSQNSSQKDDDIVTANKNIAKIKQNAKGDKSLLQIVYDKVRYPGYKDLIYTKKT